MTPAPSALRERLAETSAQAHRGSLEVEHPEDDGFRFHLAFAVTAAGADTQAAR